MSLGRQFNCLSKTICFYSGKTNLEEYLRNTEFYIRYFPWQLLAAMHTCERNCFSRSPSTLQYDLKNGSIPRGFYSLFSVVPTA